MEYTKVATKSLETCSQQVRETNTIVCKIICDRETLKVFYIQSHITAIVNCCFIWNRQVLF